MIEKDETRLQSESMTRQNTARPNYADLFDMAPVGYLTLHDQGRIIDANLTAAALLGVVRAELVNQPLLRFIHPDDQDICSLHCKQLFETGEPKTCDIRMTRANGTFFWACINALPAKGPDGVTVCRIIMSDFTERKKVEDELWESKERYRVLVDLAVDGILLGSQEGIITEANEQMCTIIGMARQDFIGKHISELPFTPESLRTTPFRFDLLQKGETVLSQRVLIRPDGSKVSVETRTKMMPDGTYQSIYRDITEHRRTEDDLKQFAAAVQNSSDAIGMSTPEGKHYYQNTAFDNLFGHIGEDPPSTLYVNENVGKEVFQTIMAGDRWIGEVEMYAKNGSVLNIFLRAYANKDECNRTIGLVGIHTDITEKKEIESRLLKSKKMEAMGLLAGGVAHDLNNILSGIVSYPDLLLLQLPESSPLRKPLLTIRESGEKAAAIVTDLLALARSGVAAYEALDLNSVVSGYLKSPEYKRLKSFFPDVELETNLEADRLNILGSPVHILKALMNLVSNAAEAISDKGKILISTENRYIDRPVYGYEKIEKGDYVTLTVSDSGTGISPEDMERIFEPFYTKKKLGKSGTGLGMAVVWGTVKDHDGYIDVQSSEGKGALFRIYFPVTRQEPAKAEVRLSVEKYMGKGQSVLVVDDVKAQRELVSAMLKTLGYSVAVTSSGEEAIRYLQNNPADLVVLDMIMDPGMNGLDTYKRILEVRPGQKAIISSGYSETDCVKEAQRLGAGKYIKKPYSLEKIGLAVKEELEK